jgi:hypothetical protein
MNIVQNNISNTLQTELQNILNLNYDYFNLSDSKLINHKLIYCNKWKVNEYDYLVDLLKNESSHLKNTFENNTLIQINIINAPPDCNDQLFHIDYEGDSISYFIPYVQLSPLNGTEYLEFKDKQNYQKYYNILLEMSKLYLDRDEIISYLSKINLVFNSDYCFSFATSNAFSLIEMPNYVYHRGQKNKTNQNRLMLNILFSIDNKYDYPADKIILDSEIDEIDRVNEILLKRMKNML